MTGLSGSSTGMYVCTENYIAMITGAIRRICANMSLEICSLNMLKTRKLDVRK